MIIKLNKIENLLIILIIISQLSTFTITTILFPGNETILQIFKYSCFLLPSVFFFKEFKIELRMLFIIFIFLLSIIINDIDSKFNSETRFFLWIILISMIGPLFYSEYLNKFKKKLLRAFLYTFMIMGSISFFYWLFGITSLGRGHFSGLFNHSMVLAPISSMGAIYAIYKFYIEKKFLYKYFYLLLFVFNFLSLVLSASRSALISLVIVLLVFSIFAKLKYKKIYLFLIIITGLLLNNLILLNLEKNDLTQSIATRGFDNTRHILWHDRLLEFKNNPFLGVGFAAQDDAIEGKIGKKGNSDGVIEPGSSYLLILSMTGMMGAIAILFFFTKYLLNITFWRNNLFNINYKILLFVFFFIHFIAEGYILSSGSIFSFIFWLLVATTYPNSYNNKESDL